MSNHFSYDRIVNFYETDAAQIVHFSNYLKYMEEAEVEFLNSVGLTESAQRTWRRTKIACSFFMPIKFNDVIRVELKVITAARKFIKYGFTLSVRNRVAAKAEYESVLVNLPEEVSGAKTEEFNYQFIEVLRGCENENSACR